MKLGQNDCLLKISDEFENWSCQVKNCQILEKPCVHSRGHIFSPIIMKCRMFVLIKARTTLKIDYVGSKTKSLGQILEKPCVYTLEATFSV